MVTYADVIGVSVAVSDYTEGCVGAACVAAAAS